MFIHGRKTVLTVNSQDISKYTKTSELVKGAQEHDTTHYGDDWEEVEPGLRNATFTCSGTYDNTATTGPRAVLEPAVGTKVPVVRQTEGVGSGLPQDSFTAHLNRYVETNPVDGFVTWAADFKVSGPVDSTPQAA